MTRATVALADTLALLEGYVVAGFAKTLSTTCTTVVIAGSSVRKESTRSICGNAAMAFAGT
jgi:hypothetical protein